MKRWLAFFIATLPVPAFAQLADWVPSSPTEHGSVRVHVAISPEGRATDCQVIRSSGTASLDTSACQMVVQQSKWEPPKDQSGRAVSGSAEMTLHFIMPHVPQTDSDLPIGPHDARILYSPSRDAAQRANQTLGPGAAKPVERIRVEGGYSYPPDALRQRLEGTVWVVIDVDPKGHPAGCGVARSSGYAVLDNATCDFALKHLRYKPGTDYYGKPIADVDLFSVDWRLPQ